MKLKEFIDKLGEIVEAKKKYEKEEKKLKEKIKKLVEAGKLKAGNYNGNNYMIQIIEQVSPEYDKGKIIELVGEETYIGNSKPDITSLKRVQIKV